MGPSGWEHGQQGKPFVPQALSTVTQGWSQRPPPPTGAQSPVSVSHGQAPGRSCQHLPEAAWRCDRSGHLQSVCRPPCGLAR